MNDAMLQGDVKPRQFASPRQPGIRSFCEADRAFVMRLVKEKYPDRPVEKAVPWVEWCLTQPDRLVLVGSHSFGVASALWHYGFERRGGLAILCSRPEPGSIFEILRMLRAMISWAKDKGCRGHFNLTADPDVDFGPVAKRLGGVELPVWKIPLE